MIRLAALIACFPLLSGCFGLTDRDPPSGQPAFYRNLATSEMKFDAESARAMISGYRQNNGLSAVKLHPNLNRIAEEHARAMAAQNTLEHTISGRTFNARIDGSGFNAGRAAENISAGYHTIAEAFSGWRDSSSHKKNMLLPGATHMGIAAVYAPQSKFKVFWAMVIAAQDGPQVTDAGTR